MARVATSVPARFKRLMGCWKRVSNAESMPTIWDRKYSKVKEVMGRIVVRIAPGNAVSLASRSRGAKQTGSSHCSNSRKWN